MRDAVPRLLSRIHATTFRASKGRIGSRLVNNDMLLLHTTGRRSGNTHTVPLLYLQHGDGVAVIASWGGRDRHPDWFLNLEAAPAAEVTIGRSRSRVMARTVDGEERRQLWDRAVSAYDGYTEYESRAARMIPVVVLERIA